MKIKSQILIAISGIFLLVAGTMSVEMILVGYDQAQQAMGDIKNLSIIHLLEARKSESEFLSKPDEELIQKNRTHMGKLKSYLDSLLADEKTSSAEYKNISEIATEVRRYEELYAKIVSNQTRMGFTDSLGLRGEMREAAHKVEAAFKGKSDYLFAGLLSARRNEKDFLMRGDTNIAQKLTSSVADLKTRMWYSGLGGRTDLTTLLDE
ncbi:MAG: hypothetical protein JNM63_00680, partial [Spirochaetia bacterium]|nr:hypothetical protein [Spirochaetia bacterium]